MTGFRRTLQIDRAMYKIGSCLLLSLVITLPAARASSENEPDEREAEARKLCDQFWQNFLQRDMNGVMKKVSVPFYEFSDGKSRVIRDKKKLRTRIDSHLPASEDPRQIKFVIKTVVRYSQLLESNPSALYEREQERRILARCCEKIVSCCTKRFSGRMAACSTQSSRLSRGATVKHALSE